METFSKIKSTLSTPLPHGGTKTVNFVILKSLREYRLDLAIVRQGIDNSTTTADILWRFSRFPEKSADRIIPRQNPHFYLQLPNDAASFDSNFHKDPLRDFVHGIRQDDTIYVLLNKSCRLFLDAAKPHIPRIFDNLWKPHQTVILKDVCGVLESEDIVLRNIGEQQDYWYRPSITDSFQRRVQSGYSDVDSEIVRKPVRNGRGLIDLALRSQNIDLMIRDRSRPEPPADSGWKPLPSPESIVRVQAPEDQTTPRQSATRLPQLEYSNPNTSAPSIGSSTLFATSIESFETVASASEVFLPERGVAGDRTQLIDNGINHQLELSTADASSPFPSSAPPADLTPMPRLRYSNPNSSTSSISGSSLMLIPNRLLETFVDVSEPPSPSLSTRTATGSIDLYPPTVRPEL
ncbi:hypothetical protein BJY52DRAFT_1307876 [Lactarius psammicola]|nr:hypothetical protein BJY52DRAFT_1307876 [Lactarius psammicola]